MYMRILPDGVLAGAWLPTARFFVVSWLRVCVALVAEAAANAMWSRLSLPSQPYPSVIVKSRVLASPARPTLAFYCKKHSQSPRICRCSASFVRITMASLAVAASVAASASSLVGSRVSSRSVATSPVVKMAAIRCEAKTDAEVMQRRAVMAAAAASLVATMSGVALAQPTSDDKTEGEPKPGSKEARKLYRRICVTMPTAKVCHY